MSTFAMSCPLVLSSILRVISEDSIFNMLADDLLLVLMVRGMASCHTTFGLALVSYIGLAFYNTRAEYINFSGNVREIDPRSLSLKKSSAASCPATPSPRSPDLVSNLSSRMCPVGPFQVREPARKIHEVLKDRGIVKIECNNCFKIPANGEEPTQPHGKPILFPCHLKHRRIAPFKDNFRHSYLYVGTPVGLHASYSPILTVDLPHDTRSRWPFRKAWFNIRAQDHAIRGGSHMTLSQKLREYLISQGADPSEWPYAYLLTAPSINGQVDNPLGFWYLYTAQRELTAIIAELNTSYGERRMWLVRQALPPRSDTSKRKAGPYVFRGHFGKDIHVSPFMPYSGGYTIDTSDPCTSNQLDILVTLTRPEGGPMLVTRVTSMAPGLDASIASLIEKVSFLTRWCWVPTTTVMTYRILSQAARIYLKAPRYWTRPEPTQMALGKPARAVEIYVESSSLVLCKPNMRYRTLERSFRLILKNYVEKHPSPIAVTYATPGEHSLQSEIFYSYSAKSKPTTPVVFGTTTPPTSELEYEDFSPSVMIQVISPTFYSRFFHYRSAHAAIASELLDDARTRTLSSSDPELFTTIFDSTASQTSITIEDSTNPMQNSFWHWRLISLLRSPPIATNFPRGIPYEPFSGLSSMDIWVMRNCSAQDVKNYRRAILRVFLGEWIGGTIGPLKRFSDDLEPFGLSRDAVLRIYDAILKAIILTSIVEILNQGESRWSALFMGLSGWASTGLDIWALIKAEV